MAALYPSFLAYRLTDDHAILYLYISYTYGLFSDSEFMRSVWQHYDALATNVDAGSASNACISTFLICLQAPCLVTSRPTLRATLDRTFMITTTWTASREMVPTTASVAVSNVVGMIGTKTGLSMQSSARRRVQWCVSSTNFLPMGCQPFLVVVFFLLASISSTRRMHRSSQMHTFTVCLRCSIPYLTLRQPREVYLPLENTLMVQKPPVGSTEPVHAPCLFKSTALA